MNIEVTYFIAIINAVLAVAVFYFSRKKDTTDDAKASAEITSELKALRREMSEVKIEVSAMRQEWREDHDALQGLHHSFASANSKTKVKRPEPYPRPWARKGERIGKGAVPISRFWDWWGAKEA